MRLRRFWPRRAKSATRPETVLEFSKALLDADAALPFGVVDPQGQAAPKRFAVYRNNVTTSLVDALAATFPAVEKLVGDGFFKQMARVFIAQSPPQSPLLAEYGRDFARFLDGFEPVKGLPFLADVALLDRAWLDAYHGLDAPPLMPEALAKLDQEALVGARFILHPAVRLVVSDFPVFDIWQAARSGQAAAGIDPELHQAALVTRPDIDVQVYGLSHGGGVFVAALTAGQTLGDAAELALADDDFDLGAMLGVLISSGALIGIEVQV